jgi:hypothetical protein
MSNVVKFRGGLSLAAAALCLGVLGPIGSAAAEETAEPALSAQAWYWSTNKRFTFGVKDPVLGAQQKFDVAAGGPVGLVPGGGISPISIGHLGVSLINGVSDMRSFARWDLGSVPQGSTVKSFVVSFTLSKFSMEHLQYHLDAEARAPSTIGEDFAKVNACPVTETLTSSEAEPTDSFSFHRPEVENQSTDINRRDQRLEPFYDCGLGSVRGEMSSTRDVLTFDLASIAQGWVDDPLSNNGVALIGASEGLTTTWILELHGAAYSARVDVGVPVSAPVPLPLPEPEQADPNQYVSEAEAVTAAIAYDLPEPEPAPCCEPPPPPPPPTIITQPGTNTTTVVNQPGITTQQTIYVPTTGTLPVGAISTPGWVLLGLPLGLLALGAMRTAIGKDELELAAVPLAGSRVATLLRHRRLDA